MLSFRIWIEEEEGPTAKLKIPGVHNPDHLYKNPSTTFVYWPPTDQLFFDEYPNTHWRILMEPETQEVIHASGNYTNRDEALEFGGLLGRVGVSETNDKQHTVIAFWNSLINGDFLAPKEKFSAAIRAIVQQIKGYDYSDAIILTIDHVTKSINDFIEPVEKTTTSLSQESPQCQELGVVDVQGQQMKLPEIMAALHMVRGQKYDQIKVAFCSQYKNILKNISTDNCPTQLRLANHLLNQFQCGQQDYQKALKAGRFTYRQELKNLFSKPAELEKRFRTQKEIDAAWDDLVHGKREAFLGFKEWLLLLHRAQRPVLRD